MRKKPTSCTNVILGSVPLDLRVLFPNQLLRGKAWNAVNVQQCKTHTEGKGRAEIGLTETPAFLRQKFSQVWVQV